MTLQHTNRRDSLKTLAALGAVAASPLAFAQKPLTVGFIYVGPRTTSATTRRRPRPRPR
jgi:basic membrane protein A